MEYLKYYNLTDQDINLIATNLDSCYVNDFYLNPEKIKNIIDYLVQKGIRNIKQVIMFRPQLFQNDLEGIKKSFETSDLPNFIEQINEDIVNFELIGL
ncbi:MAG TPA: hypothetical protein PK737_00280 [Bacilli bacterium]|nr:hypothetical protein [Bacilli bacterium]